MSCMDNKKIVEVGYGNVPKVIIGDRRPLVFIGGPCAIESRDHAFKMADEIGEICRRAGITWIYKSCYDKDCRSSPDSYHGLGMHEGLRILADVREKFGIPVTSDFSDPAWGANEIRQMCRWGLRYPKPGPKYPATFSRATAAHTDARPPGDLSNQIYGRSIFVRFSNQGRRHTSRACLSNRKRCATPGFFSKRIDH